MSGKLGTSVDLARMMRIMRRGDEDDDDEEGGGGEGGEEGLMGAAELVLVANCS